MTNIRTFLSIAVLTLCFTVQTTQANAQVLNKSKDKELKPSAAAIAADPKASDNTVPNGHTLSYAERRAAYEQLPDNVYLKPYYHPKLQHYYFLDDDAGKQNLWTSLYSLFQEHRPLIIPRNNLESNNQFLGIRFSTLGFFYGDFIPDTIPEGNKKVYEEAVLECTGYMPIGVHAIFAYMGLFAADPQGFFPFEFFCQAIVGYGDIEHTRWSRGNPNDLAQYEDIAFSNGTKGKLTVPFQKVLKNMRTELGRLHDLAFEVTPMVVIQSAAARYYNNVTKFEKEEKYSLVMYNYFLFETAMYFWKFNSKFEKDKTFDYLMNEYDKFRALYEKKWKNGAMLTDKPVEMPKTYDWGADFTKNALEVAKNSFDFKVDKVIFTSAKGTWNEFKEQQWPYRVMHRSTNAALLSKEGDKWIIRYYFYIQKSDEKGGWLQKFSFQAGGDYQPKPVNYKP